MHHSSLYGSYADIQYSKHDDGGGGTGSSSGGSSSRTYRLTWRKLNTVASRTRYTNYKEKN